LPIVGFSMKIISAVRKRRPAGRIDINSTPKIVSVEKAEVGFTKREESLDIGFEFITEYKPDIAEIRMAGNVMYLGKKVKEGFEMWKEKKKLPQEVEIEVKNFLFRKCLSMGIDLSQQMNLPPPLLFPRIMPKQKEREADLRYIG